MAHYQRYRLIPEQKYEYWKKNRTIIEFVAQFPKASLLENPASVWFSIKHNLKESVSFRFSKPTYFGLRLAIKFPERNPKRIVSLVKPIFDGAIAAFHQHDGTDQQEISRRISSIINQPADCVSSYLSEAGTAVLGKRKLLYLRSQGVQWNPADDFCVLGELYLEEALTSSVDLSGELFLLSRNETC